MATDADTIAGTSLEMAAVFAEHWTDHRYLRRRRWREADLRLLQRIERPCPGEKRRVGARRAEGAPPSSTKGGANDGAMLGGPAVGKDDSINFCRPH